MLKSLDISLASFEAARTFVSTGIRHGAFAATMRKFDDEYLICCATHTAPEVVDPIINACIGMRLIVCGVYAAGADA